MGDGVAVLLFPQQLRRSRSERRKAMTNRVEVDHATPRVKFARLTRGSIFYAEGREAPILKGGTKCLCLATGCDISVPQEANVQPLEPGATLTLTVGA